MVYDWFLRDSVAVGTGFSHPVFNPTCASLSGSPPSPPTTPVAAAAAWPASPCPASAPKSANRPPPSAPLSLSPRYLGRPSSSVLVVGGRWWPDLFAPSPDPCLPWPDLVWRGVPPPGQLGVALSFAGGAGAASPPPPACARATRLTTVGPGPRAAHGVSWVARSLLLCC